MTRHLFERLQERDIAVRAMLFAVQHGERAEPYTEPPEHGGTTWRIFGKDPQGRRLAVGVEAYRDEQGRAAVLCTVFESKGSR
jgi:hypothetical protein